MSLSYGDRSRLTKQIMKLEKELLILEISRYTEKQLAMKNEEELNRIAKMLYLLKATQSQVIP